MSGYYGLIELLLVFGIVFAWGLWELRGTRRYKRDAETRREEPKQDATASEEPTTPVIPHDLRPKTGPKDGGAQP